MNGDRDKDTLDGTSPQAGEARSGGTAPSTQNGEARAQADEARSGSNAPSPQSCEARAQADPPDVRTAQPRSKRDNPFSAYAVASQVGFLVIIPLLVFIWGGSWLVNRFSLPGWLMIVFVFLGIFVMIGSVTSYLYRMIRMYGGDRKPEKNSELKHDIRDHDYYDSY